MCACVIMCHCTNVRDLTCVRLCMCNNLDRKSMKRWSRSLLACLDTSLKIIHECDNNDDDCDVNDNNDNNTDNDNDDKTNKNYNSI